MDTLKNIISCTITLLKLCIFKVIYRKRICFGIIERFSPNTVIKIGSNSKLILGNKVRAHSGTKIQVRDNASVTIGDNVAFNYNCIVTAREAIDIGEGCEIGPNVMFYDHDHDVKSYSIKDKKYSTDTITLGKNVWVGANAIILKGAKVADGCVIAAGTVVTKGDYPKYSLIKSDRKLTIVEDYAFHDED